MVLQMNKFQARVNLSIIICTYNSSKYLNDCFKSLFLKNNGKHEIVVIDDNSSDNTIKILKKWKKNSLFSINSTKKNRGVSYCRNLGIKNLMENMFPFVTQMTSTLKIS